MQRDGKPPVERASGGPPSPFPEQGTLRAGNLQVHPLR